MYSKRRFAPQGTYPLNSASRLVFARRNVMLFLLVLNLLQTTLLFIHASLIQRTPGLWLRRVRVPAI